MLASSAMRNTLLFFFFVIFLLIVPSPASNVTKCLQTCHLKVNDDEIAYLRFIKTISDSATRVVYFDILRDRYYNVNATLFAWVRDNVGAPIFSLPIDYIATSFNLPLVFIDYVPIEFNESAQSCYIQSSQFCQKIMIMSALAKMTRLDNRCNGTNCGSLCRRHFHFQNRGDLEDNIYSCCPEDSLAKEVDLLKCLEPDQMKPYIPILSSFTIVLGALISLNVLSAATNQVIKSLGSTMTTRKYDSDNATNDNSDCNTLRKIYILSPLTRQTYVHNYFKYLAEERPSVLKMHYIYYTIIGITAIMGAGLSLTIQTLPLPFVTSLRLVVSEIPWIIIITAISLAFYLIISIFFIRIYLSCIRHHKNSKQYHYKSCQVRSFYQFPILNYLDIWHPIKFISQFIRIQIFQDNSSLSIINGSKIIYFMSLANGFITIASLSILLQCIFRMIISAAVFIIAYSLHFSNIITITIPFIYYIYITIYGYNSHISNLSKDIAAVLPKVEDKVKTILEADKGEIEVYFKVNQDPTVVVAHTEIEIEMNTAPENTDVSVSYSRLKDISLIIDLPEILIAHEEEIKNMLCIIFNTKCVQFGKGIYKIIFHYNKNEGDTILVDLPSCNEHYLYRGCCKDLEQLTNVIEEYLRDRKIYQLKKKLVQVHDRIGNIDEIECDTIPESLFNWIRYCSPVLSCSIWTVIWKIIISSGIYAALILAIPGYSQVDSLAEFNAAISKLPVSLITIIIAVKSIQESTVDEEAARKILLYYLIRYRRGYKFFYEEGQKLGIFRLLMNYIRSLSSFGKFMQHNLQNIRLPNGSRNNNDCS
ncbi:hypothetical protein TrispH2_008871 [Trichoplax sp. H2]|nr:hypothetical protein TrispH2_008871 [Trichoplax sp. H2]|eukprot:RDD39987.1 hypothetical protein TrispH2_008871 [Trichoplax sp. H2]